MNELNFDDLEAGEGVRRLATIQPIESVAPIEGADRIELVRCGGYQMITQKSNNFKVGDLCVFLELDSVAPITNPNFEFLKGKPLKTMRMRGYLSQGLVMPLSVLDGLDVVIQEGTDVTEFLGITKYIKSIRNSGGPNKDKPRGNFPGFLRKTDEIRVQAVRWILEEHHGEHCYVTEKLDGSSITVYFKLNEHRSEADTDYGYLGVCSRNLEIQESEESKFWIPVTRLKLKENMARWCMQHNKKSLTLQGELLGPGVQNNMYDLFQLEIRFFDAYDIETASYYDFADAQNIFTALQIESVPVLDTNFILPYLHDVDSLIESADNVSKLNGTKFREGVVIRSIKEKFLPKLGRFSFKIISNKFLELN